MVVSWDKKGHFWPQKAYFFLFLGGLGYKTIDLLIWPHLAIGQLLTFQYLYITGLESKVFSLERLYPSSPVEVRNFVSTENLGSKSLWFQKRVWVKKKFQAKINFGYGKIFGSKKNVENFLVCKKNLGRQIFFGCEQISGPKKIR